jgi:hypothetical protein
MRDVWLTTAGIAFGWLLAKSWSDPGCRVGVALFLVATAAMALAFMLALVGHRRDDDAPQDDDDEAA